MTAFHIRKQLAFRYTEPNIVFSFSTLMGLQYLLLLTLGLALGPLGALYNFIRLLTSE